MTFRARDQVSFDYAQDKLLTLLTSKKNTIRNKKKPYRYDKTFRARDQVYFDCAQYKLLTLLTSKKNTIRNKKSLIDMIRLLERETRFELATFSLEG